MTGALIGAGVLRPQADRDGDAAHGPVVVDHIPALHDLKLTAVGGALQVLAAIEKASPDEGVALRRLAVAMPSLRKRYGVDAANFAHALHVFLCVPNAAAVAAVVDDIAHAGKAWHDAVDPDDDDGA
jgi:hypothetical protein